MQHPRSPILCLIKQISNRNGGFFLGGGGDMGVGVQRKSGGKEAQDGGHGFDVHTVLQGYRCKGVAEVVEPHLGDACSSENSLQHIIDTIRRDRAACWIGEYIFAICFGFLLFQNFYCIISWLSIWATLGSYC